MEVDATPHADNRSFVYVSRVRSTHDVSPAAKFIFRRWNDVQTPVSRPRSSSPYSRTICARQSAWLLYAPQRAISRTAGPSQFRKTMHAPPPLRTSRHTASASCRVGRPMRAVYRSLVPKARLRSFRISGFSLFSGAGRDCTVDRNSLTATAFWKCPDSCAPHGAQVPSVSGSRALRRRVSARVIQASSNDFRPSRRRSMVAGGLSRQSSAA